MPVFIGAGNRNRTRDLLITNQLLYLLSYAGTAARIIGLHATFTKITPKLGTIPAQWGGR